MVFSSAIFLFVFFPAVFVLYHLVPGLRAKNFILIIASLVFYSFGNAGYLLLLLASVLINYSAGVLLMKVKDSRKAVLASAVVLNVALLAVFKYLDFAVSQVNALTGLDIPAANIVLPVGISFYTFQGISYIVDVYRDEAAGSINFGKILLYISFFPQLIAGPIIKYHDVADMISDRRCTPEDTAAGVRRFIIGLSKKLLIANTVGSVADQVFGCFGSGLDFRIAWLGALCYTLQIYYDFSGYSDMAIGLGRIFGFKFLENFDHPYMASSIKDFWRRWHISLSSWFRDYVYFPLGGSYCSRFRAGVNKFIVFFTTGLWHGANWTFVLWGLWHGFIGTLEDNGVIPVKKTEGRLVGHIYTLMVVMLGFVLFRAESMEQAGYIFSQMFTGFEITEDTQLMLHNLLSRANVAFILLAVLLSYDWIGLIKRRLEKSSKAAVNFIEFLSYAGVFALFLYDILNISQTTFNPFIYFQF